MPNPTDHIIPSAEIMAIPQERPVLFVPLTGAVELSYRSEKPDTPEARTEAFLDANGAIFSAVDDAWKGVKASQQAYQELINQFAQEISGGTLSREVRRSYRGFNRDFANSNVTFGTCKQRASVIYPKILQNMDDGNRWKIIIPTLSLI